MPTVIPYVPQRITVHLGAPSANAENVTVSFVDYVKNVACSEIYPTWEEGALRANILAIVSFALNRVYTEFYRSQGQKFYTIAWNQGQPISPGDRGIRVEHLQYMLRVLSAYISQIPSVTVDGVYGSATRSAVLAAQGYFRLPQTGTVDLATWDEIYDQFAGIENASLRDLERFPYTSAVINQTLPRNRYSRTSAMTQFPGYDLSMNNQDAAKQEVVR